MWSRELRRLEWHSFACHILLAGPRRPSTQVAHRLVDCLEGSCRVEPQCCYVRVAKLGCLCDREFAKVRQPHPIAPSESGAVRCPIAHPAVLKSALGRAGTLMQDVLKALAKDIIVESAHLFDNGLDAARHPSPELIFGVSNESVDASCCLLGLARDQFAPAKARRAVSLRFRPTCNARLQTASAQPVEPVVHQAHGAGRC
mmetsp:Transcript_260/g.682  ORF Transcript_260/g.682 Transcript_260/m.682 type:complete len:201 (-) Transcript_260:1340-1942(-)